MRNQSILVMRCVDVAPMLSQAAPESTESGSAEDGGHRILVLTRLLCLTQS